MKVLHAADLHIDSPMKGMERYDGAPVDVMRGSTRKAVSNLVDLAIREQVDIVTIGGDVFDGDWHEVTSGLWWNSQLDRLVAAGIEVFVVHGNHDAASQLTHRLRAPRGVHVFGTDAPQSIHSDRHPLVVHGQSYRDRAVTDDLAAGFPQAVPGLFNIGLLHTSLDGRPGHASYAPCTAEGLRAKQYELWALGHVHQREQGTVGDTHILFPGNTQGRHARECGPKGVSIIGITNGQVDSIQHHPVDAVRWASIGIDTTALPTLDAVIEQAVDAVAAARRAADRPLAVRLELTGTSSLHAAVQGTALETLRLTIISELSRNEGDVWVEKLLDRTASPRTIDVHDADALQVIQRLLDRALTDDALVSGLPGTLSDLGNRFAPTLHRMGPEAGSRPDAIDQVRARLPQAAELLITRMGGRR